MTEYTKPLPHITPPTQPFWEATRAGHLEVQKCTDCGHMRFPPSKICDECMGEEATWQPVSGFGAIWSVCEFHRVNFKGFEAEMPYNAALVRLDEGPRMYTNLVAIAYDDIEIGMRVEAVFEMVTESVTLLKNRPVAQSYCVIS